MLNRCANYGDMGFWMRKVYQDDFQKQEITAVIRPKDRTDPKDFTHIPAGVPVPVRFVSEPAKTPTGVPGNLLPDDGTTIERTEVIVKALKDLTEEDLQGCAPDCVTPELTRYHLGNTYNMELPGPDFVVTIWRFKYLPKATE